MSIPKSAKAFSLQRQIAVAALLIAQTAATFAGPVADFERTLATAYAPYRAALFQTNQKDKAATEKSLDAFATAWGNLARTYRTAPPPQYVDDPAWTETIATIDKIISTAKDETAKGDLAKAHDVLEAIRDRLGELRARNGVITYSDRVDAYHHQMEVILAAKYGGADGAGLLREDAAVLQHLSALLEQYAPAALKGDGAFKESLGAVTASAKALQVAARTGDRSEIEKALKALKPAYARMFVRFG